MLPLDLRVLGSKRGLSQGIDMGLLGDIYSTIDSKKRQLKGLLADPVETLKLGLLNFKNDQNALLDTQAQAYPFIPRTQDQQARIPTFKRTQEQARKELADQGANMGMAAATVWHGSPHKFDKFDSSKIGTGEGAQAYGHGLYLAESPDVAKAYRSNLVKDATFIEKKTGRTISKEMPEYADILETQARMERNGYGATFDKRYDVKEGGLYKVDLPDEAIAKMLDWDKPLSQQSPEVQSVLQKALQKNPNMTGEDLYRKFSIGDTSRPHGANTLKDMGIPGIRYLDGGSRNTSAGELIAVTQGPSGWQAKIRKTPSGQAGDIIPMANSFTTSKPFPTEQAARDWANSQIGGGTSNFVIFPGNEGLLTILERNGQGLLGQ